MSAQSRAIKIGFGSYALRWAIGTPDFASPRPLTPFTLLDKAAALGAEVVQILDNLPLDGLSDAALDELSHHARDLGLDLEIGIRGSRPAQLRRNLAIAHRLRARLLRVVLADEGWLPDFDQVVSALHSLLPDLRAAGVTLAIENRFHFLPSEVARLVETIDDPAVRACLDVMNSITRLVGPRAAVEALAPWAVSVHIKDAVIRREGTGFRLSGCPLGEGQVDIPGILQALRAAGCVRSLLVEGWMDRLDDMEATLLQEETWVRDGMAYLQRLWDGKRHPA